MIEQEQRREQCEQQELNSVRDVALLRAEVVSLRNELAQVRGEIDQRHHVALEACGQALGETRRQVIDDMQTEVRAIHNQLLSLIERRYAEVMGRIDAIIPDRLRANAKGFRFANERHEHRDTVVHVPETPHSNAVNDLAATVRAKV